VIQRSVYPYMFPLGALTEEEILARVLKRVGPCVAIGEPGQNLPELGFHRLYVEDASWKARVEELMATARVVFLRAYDSDAVLWEMETAKQILTPERLVIVRAAPDATDERDNYFLFREKVQRQLGIELPRINSTPIHGSSLDGFIYFDEGWTPRYASLKGLDERSLRRSVEIALDPVFRRLGVKSRRRLLRLFSVIPPWVFVYAIAVLVLWALIIFVLMGW
jgi:hypothetical protein